MSSIPSSILSYLWGIETTITIISNIRMVLILSYLWGIETSAKNLCYEDNIWILSYLWGIETFFADNRKRRLNKILSYLWGIETGYSWNINVQNFGFYLTYEELKLKSALSLLKRLSTILSYLWGIETFLHDIHTDRLSSDFILPMRNWNSS